MAWENASGFGNTKNPLLLDNSWLAQINDTFNNSGQRSQTLWSGDTLPTGITVNTDYLDLPSTNWQNETLESHDNVTWQYRKDVNRAGINLIINNSVYIDPGIYMEGGQVISFGFVINHELHKAKVSAAFGNGTNYNYIYVYYKDSTNAEVLYNALIGNPYDFNRSGGAGSGYIGNSLLFNKKMVGCNVPTSSAEGTKTESVNEASETPVSGKPKIGNGFCRIKFLRTINPPDEYKYYIDYINKREDKNTSEGFFFYNWPDKRPYGTLDEYKHYPLTKLSYRNPGNVQTAGIWTNSVYACEPITVKINKVEGSNYYSWTINGQYVAQFETTSSSYQQHFAYYSSSNSQRYTDKAFWGSTYGVTDNPPTFTDSIHNNTLTACFELLKAEYRNINIYVDGEPWAIVDFS